jgi:DNA mismatch endonuclease (patch repair protein)
MKYKKRSKVAISYAMSRVKSFNTSLERRFAKELCKNEIRGYRRNLSTIIGKPDFSWKQYRIAVFCDSSFWHGYQFEFAKNKFKSNKKYWIRKIQNNIHRDKRITSSLRKDKWLVLRFWDFQIENEIDGCIRKVKRALLKRRNSNK